MAIRQSSVNENTYLPFRLKLNLFKKPRARARSSFNLAVGVTNTSDLRHLDTDTFYQE